MLFCDLTADFDEDQSDACLDCNDDDSSVFPGAEETCDGLDNDCDPSSADGSEDPENGTACDGLDTDLCVEGIQACSGGVLVCSDTTDSSLEICGNAIDDDCDGLTDCFDSDCATDSSCRPRQAEECLVEGDEDEDGAADCDDADCVTILDYTQCESEASILCFFNCLVDTQDCADCLVNFLGPQTETACGDLVDNDADGAVDCNDLDCALDVSACP